MADGRVRVNRERVTQPSRLVRVEDVLTVRLPRTVHVVRVVGLAERRVSPAATATLYVSLAED